MSLSFAMKFHSRPPPRRMEHTSLDTTPRCTNSSFHLPDHERDFTGGTDPLSRGGRRLEAREGPGCFWRAARAEIEYVRTRFHRHTQVPFFISVAPNGHLVEPGIFTNCRSTASCMHNKVGLDNLSPVFFFIASRQWSHDSSDRVRLPTWPHGVKDHPGPCPCPHVLLPSVLSDTPGGKGGEGEVGDVVFGRSHDAAPLVQVDHGRLDIGVAQHGLELLSTAHTAYGPGCRRVCACI